MRIISLTQGKTTQVDDDDYESLSQYKWHAHGYRGTFYAVRSVYEKGKRSTVLMHRVILKASPGEEVDHEDHDGLNNQKSNLRLTNSSGNKHNRGKQKNNTVGYKGVTFRNRCNLARPYEAKTWVNGKFVYIGMFVTPEAAARAYDEVATKLHGKFACLNFPLAGEE